VGFHLLHKATTAVPGHLAEHVRTVPHPVLVEFANKDIPTCRMEEPVLAKILRRYADRLAVLQADVETSGPDAAELGVTAVPTFILFVDGTERMRLVGYQTLEQLTNALDQALPPAEAA
jgi:thioredoxin 1